MEVSQVFGTVHVVPEANQVQPLVSVRDGKCFCTSLVIAEKFEKEHRHVLEAIRSQMAVLPENFTEPNFRLSGYKDSTGRTLPMFELTRDGFSFIVMGFTGEKAALWKVKFIEAFNAMEKQLHESMPNFNDPIEAAEAWLKEAKAKRAAEEQARLEAEAHAKTTQQLEAANDALGHAREFRSCIAMSEELAPYFNIRFKDFEGDSFYAQLGKFMVRLCEGRIISTFHAEINKEYVPNARYNWINVYSVLAWDFFFQLCKSRQINSKTPFIGKYWRG